MKTSILSAAILALIVASPIQAQNPQGPGPKGGKQQHFLQTFDTDNNGIVTEEEFKTASNQRYQSMDKDGDGSVSVEEFQQYSSNRHHQWLQKKHQAMDSDQNGTISKQEFIDQAVKRAEQRFAALDKNQDGILSADEHEAQRGMKKGPRLMKRMDQNNDGQISQEEHAAMMERWFSKMDRNNDKQVSGDELQGFRRHKGQ